MRTENLFWKIPIADKLPAMKLPTRLLLAALVLSIGSLTPIVPGETSLAILHTSNCCASMKMVGCHRCPATMGETTSGFASSCCVSQSACLALYFSKATPFSASVHLLGVIGVSDERATTRIERPPVPPPRSVFS
jgi:hypothetical protein